MLRKSMFRFSLFQWAMIAVIALLGLVTGKGATHLTALTEFTRGLPGGLQWLAGAHVLWLVVAAGLVRRPGAATVAGCLMGLMEFAAGSQHGLAVLMLAVAAGLAIDAVWLGQSGLGHLATVLLSGGVGAGSNVFVQAALMPNSCVCASGSVLAISGGAAFMSGIIIGGVVGWLILRLLNSFSVLRQPDRAPADAVAVD